MEKKLLYSVSEKSKLIESDENKINKVVNKDEYCNNDENSMMVYI